MAKSALVEHWLKALRKQKPAIYVLADRLAPAMRKRFLLAIAALQGRVDLDALAAALTARDLTAAERLIGLDALPKELASMADVIRQVFQGAGQVAAGTLGSQLGASVSFSTTNPRAVQWARTQSSRLITNVTNETREAVRTVIGDAIEHGIPPRTAARVIRDQVGLTPGQSAAVVRRYERLIADGRSVDEAGRAAGRYSAKLLKYRGEVIARTETIRSSTEGQQELWRQAVDRGLIDRDTKRVWIVTDDDRLCPICEPMDGQEVGLEEAFESDGERALVPPIHPQCRCAVALSFRRAQEAA